MASASGFNARVGALFVVVGLSFAACVPTDITGCPLEPLEALGQACSEEGKECGEASLCDPCVSDGSMCESVKCEGGIWVEAPWPDTCADGGAG